MAKASPEKIDDIVAKWAKGELTLKEIKGYSDDELYANAGTCTTVCGAFSSGGDVGSMTGDTIQCRINQLAMAAGVLRGFASARFECADLRTADLGSHDLVTMVDLLHYIPIPEQETLARRIADAVRPGGTLLFREGCTDRAGHRGVSRWERIALATRFTRAEGGLHFQTEQGWSTLMRRCGLEIETVGSGPGSNVIFLCRKPNN